MVRINKTHLLATELGDGRFQMAVSSEYFWWLLSLVNVTNREDPNIPLLRFLSVKKFFGRIPNDQNRAVDGLSLRQEFEYMRNPKLAGLGEQGFCSFLEMLVALARRIDYNMWEGGEETTSRWFWEMIDNMQLKAVDENSSDYNDVIAHNERILENILDRRIGPDGSGGLFPLKRTNNDQREVEIWYQMMEYIQQ